MAWQLISPEMGRYLSKFHWSFFLIPALGSYLSLGFTVYIIFNLLFPEIIKFPYSPFYRRGNRNSNNFEQEDPETKQHLRKPGDFPIIYDKDDIQKACVLAGSFNPPHLGHYGMIQFLSKEHKKVNVVVGFNPSKTYPVSPETRYEIVKKMCEKLPNVEVHLVEGLIWKFALRRKCEVLYR